ncbi:hypothetical protein [Paraburkholderia sp.]|uniref:hypothetical protein n=1 Tax=Paraburkholderia sp. TaxID=1926495 RepID=UPI00286F6E8B|nr:hypothetical protein [Paraburkholderia sp.]
MSSWIDQPRTLEIASAALPTWRDECLFTVSRLTGVEKLGKFYDYTVEIATKENVGLTVHEAKAMVKVDELVGKQVTVKIAIEGSGTFGAGNIGVTPSVNVGANVREITGLIVLAECVGADNHPTGAKFYQREWSRGNLGTVEFMQGKHNVVIDNVLSVLGFADKDVPEGIYQWSISFGVSPEQADTHEAARARMIAILGNLRAVGWTRYINAGDPRLRGRAAWLYASAFPVATYSLDSEYLPTEDEWKAMLSKFPRWTFQDEDGAYLEVSLQESNMGGFVGKSTYLLTVDVKSEYAFYGLGYFPGNAEKIHNWKALLPAELQKYRAERLKKEAALRAQGYTIDTAYQDPPIKTLQVSPANSQ